MSNIGFIGLGIMGTPMAGHLIKGGHTLFLHSRSGVPAALLEAGGRACASAQEVARNADVVITMVPDTPDVERLLFGDGGVAAGLSQGKLVIDMSSISPIATKQFAQRITALGARYLDAPVSGGEVGAIAGTLSIMVGGTEAAFAKVRPAFECMGTNIVHVGASGAGQVTKAANQIVTGMGVLAVAEAFAFAAKNGVDRSKVREALLGGFAYSKILENHGQRMLDRNFKPGFKSWMHEKDLNIVMQTAHELGLCLPGSAATAQMFNAMVGSGMGDEDSVALLKLLEKLSGQE